MIARVWRLYRIDFHQGPQGKIYLIIEWAGRFAE